MVHRKDGEMVASVKFWKCEPLKEGTNAGCAH
jgi:hypothetical protein